MIFNPILLTSRTREICEVERFFFEKGWCPATNGHYSCRLNNDLIAITVSGHHKSELTQLEENMVPELACNLILNVFV